MTRCYAFFCLSVVCLIFIACAGPGRVQKRPSVVISSPDLLEQDEDDGALSLDQITLADSLLLEQAPERILQEAQNRYDTAVTSLAAADTAAARMAIDEVLSLMVVLNDEEDPAITDGRKALLKQVNRFILSTQHGQLASIEVKGVIPRVFNNSVKKKIQWFTESNPGGLKASYARSGRYGDMIPRELALKGMPQELQWLPVIESSFSARAYSWADAAGMWQFIYETGKRYGLTRNGWVDDRMDPYKATPAALGYLSDLYDMFDDWLLALAAYNCGEARVLRAINRYGTRDFWELRLPRETVAYVPKFLAVVHILDNPEQYGITLPDLMPTQVFEEVPVDKAITLKDAAAALDIPLEDLKALNTGLRYGVTPSNGYALRVPLGVGSTFAAIADGIPTANFTPPPEIQKYRVRKGDTLGHIASNYKTSVRKLKSMNNLRSNLIRIGQTLSVPGKSYGTDAWAMASTATTSTVKSTGSANRSASTHKVRRGDTLYDIAVRYGTSVAALKSTNGVKGNNIRIGQTLRLPGRHVDQTSQASSTSVAQTAYKIRSGDTLSEIAEKFRISLTTLKRANPYVKPQGLKVGQTINIPGAGASPNASKRPEIHIVRRGDSLWNIARQYGVPVTQILNLNGLKRSSVIRPGQRLKLT